MGKLNIILHLFKIFSNLNLETVKTFPFYRTEMPVQISKKRKFVQDGVFKAELNEFLTRELAEDGYSGGKVRVTPSRTEIIILATRTQNVLGNKGQRIRELTSVVQKRFNYPDGAVELYAEKVQLAVFAPSPRPNPSVTNSSAVWPSAAPATESSDSSWSQAPRDAKWLFLASFAVKEPR